VSFTLNTVMTAIATEVTADLPAGTRVYAYPVPNPVPPCLIVGYPTSLEYDVTFHAIASTGKIKAIFPVRYVVPRVIDRTALDAISAVVTGAPGIPESLGGNLAGSVDTCNVDSVVRFESEKIADIDYEVVIFQVQVIA
jgi:hypothetical protein